MGKKNPLYVANIIKVFDFEKELVAYMKKRAGEGWRPCDIAPHEVRADRGPRRAWINDAGNVIVQKNSYFTAFRSIEGFRAIEEYEESHWGMNAYEGFDADFVDNVPAMIEQLFATLKIKTQPEYTKEEFAKLAKKCSARSFDTTTGLAAVTAYCGQYIISRLPDFTWGLEARTENGYKDFLPYIHSDLEGRVNVPWDILHALDKRYSNEFLWGAVPLKVQYAFKERTGEELLF